MLAKAHFLAGVADARVYRDLDRGVNTLPSQHAANLGLSLGFGLAARQPAINVEGAMIGDNVAAARHTGDLGDGEAALAEEGILAQLRGHELQTDDGSGCLIDGVHPAFRGRGVTGAAMDYEAEFDPAALPASHLQVGRFAEEHPVGAQAPLFDEVANGQPLTGLLLHHTNHIEVASQPQAALDDGFAA